jgi:hypothetical protein
VDGKRFDGLIQRLEEARLTRLGALQALAGAAAGLAGAVATPSVAEAGKCGAKCAKKCERQVGKCETVVRAFCEDADPGGTGCLNAVLPCCDPLQTCNSAASTQCFIDELFMPILPSDRAMKANFGSVDPADMLERVRALPITTWNYLADHPAVRHIGPMAQDFAALFAVGADDRHIHPIDGQGVALAAIQGLAAEVDRLQREQAALVERIAALADAEWLGAAWNERPPERLRGTVD